MDRDVTRDFIEAHGIVAIKADKTKDSPAIDALLVELGNDAKAIPYVAIYPAGAGQQPITLDGVFASPDPILKALGQAVGKPPQVPRTATKGTAQKSGEGG